MAMVLSLAFPKVSFGMSNNDFCIRAQTTVPEATSGNAGVLYGSVFCDVTRSGGASLLPHVLSALSAFDMSLLDQEYFLVSFQPSNWNFDSGILRLNKFDSTLIPCVVCNNSSSSSTNMYLYASYGTTLTYYDCYISSSGFGNWSSELYGSVTHIYGQESSDPYGEGYNISFVLDCNFPVISGVDALIGSIGSPSGNSSNSTTVNWLGSGGVEQCQNLFADTQGYNIDGDIVDSGGSGVEIESNDNHLYFKSVEIGFCEPKGIINYNSFGGAYVYVRYTVDDWIVKHITDFEIIVGVDTRVGNNRYQGTVTLPLDYDGCVVVPLSQFYTVVNAGFFTVTENKVVEQNFYKTYLYSLSSQQMNNFVSNNDDRLVPSWSDLLNLDINTDGYYRYLANTFGWNVSGGIIDSVNDLSGISAIQFNPYLVSVGCMLQDIDNNKSGRVIKNFNLVDGSDFAEDTSGLVNENPFVPNDDSTSSDDYVPSIPTNNSTDSQLVVYTGGTWSGVMNAVIGFDPGYRDLKNDLNENPEGNFTNYLAPFKDQSVSSFVGDTVSGFPVEIKTILVSGFGILTLLGIYRFIRRG